ncbi:MAG TPA: hypothetical protein VNN79_06170 [Actinomycetota bacterium]|nr:hypothetical protein [Actinomycetota bacterium]
MTLHAVAPGEKKAKRKTVSQAAQTGTRRELLEAIRDRIALEVTDLNTPARDLAALTKRLAEVISDIDGLDDEDSTEDAPAEDEAFDPSSV